MRILFVSDTYYPHINGVYYFVCRIGPLLQQKGHQVAVIAPSGSLFSAKKKVDGLDVHYLPSVPAISYPTIRFTIPVFLKKRIQNIIEGFKPDIIHIQDHLLICKTVVKINAELKIPIIATNHFMPENITFLVPGQKPKELLEKVIWKNFTGVFNNAGIVTTPTETGARLIRPKIKVKTIAVSSGIDLSSYNYCGNTAAIREKYHIPDKPVLLYVGRLDPEKHIEEILNAVAIALRVKDFRFVLIGKGMSRNSLERHADQLGINDKVIFTGFVPDEDLPCLYKTARCFVIASIAELLSLATLQAMASGLPVIAVKASALTELARDNVNGFLYNEGDIESLSAHIVKIITDDELFRSMSAKSLEIVQEHDIANTVNQFEKLYTDLISNSEFNLLSDSKKVSITN